LDCRILYVVRGLLGGIERQLYYLLKTMDRQRYRPAVAIWDSAAIDSDSYLPKLDGLSVPVFVLSSGVSRIAKIAELRRLIERLKPEVVHSHSFYTNFEAWCATLGGQCITIGSVRTDFHHCKKSRGLLLGRFSARWPRHQIFNSFAAAEQARNELTFFAPRQVFVIRNGIDFQHFTTTPPPNIQRTQIIAMGHLHPRKRWDRLLWAARDLKKKGLEFFVRVAGRGPLRVSLESQAHEFGLQNCVQFIGHIDDISEALMKANFLVHTSDFEGCPNVVMEAMASGRAVIATDTGDTANVVDDGRTGFVVRRGDHTALVERMKILITNQQLCRMMGELGRSKAELEFCLDRLASETLAAYTAAGWQDH
jgi:glycosyltransferase involved in cell wall biosynthesis